MSQIKSFVIIAKNYFELNFLGNFMLHNFIQKKKQFQKGLGFVTSPVSKMVERELSCCTDFLCFFPSLVSCELVLLFTEPKLNRFS